MIGRAVEAIDDARGDDADHAGVPAFGAEHDAAAIVAVEAVARSPAASAGSRIFFSIAWRCAVLLFEIRGDLDGLLVGSALVSISTASRAWPMRPQALRRGASMKPTW